MKNQNPQEILNEILLRMKYNSSMTLSENKKILSEQPPMSPTQPFDLNMYYYDINGNRKKKESILNRIPTGAKEARALYPNAKSLNDLPTYRPTLNLSTKAQPTQKQTVTTKLPEFDYNKPKTSEDTKKFQDWLDIYYPTWYNNGKLNKGVGYGTFGPSTTKAWNNEIIKMDWYNNGGAQKSFNKLIQKYNLKYPFNFKNLDKLGKYISTDSYLTQQLYGQPSGEYEAFAEDLKNVKNEILKIDQDTYNRIFPGKPESKPIAKFDRPQISYRDATTLVRPNMLSPEEMVQNQEIAQKAALRAKRVEYDSLSGIVELPGDAVVEYWTYDDIKDFPSFKKNVIDLDNTAVNIFSFFRPDFSKGIKSFKLNRQGVELNFKQVVQNYGFNGFGILEEQGKVYYYNKYDFVKETFWEENGGTILTAASLALAFLPATWPVLLLQSGLQLTDAARQLEMGDTEGAKLSALFAIIPFVSKAIIKVPQSTTNSLMTKFKDAKTAQDVSNVVKTLGKDELNVLKNIREAGDLSTEIKKVATSKEVKDAINATAKQVPGFAKIASKRLGFELGASGLAMYSRWDNMKSQVISEMTNRQLLQQTIEILKQKIKDEETQKKLDQFQIDSTNQSTQVIAQGLENILKDVINKEEKDKQFILEQLKTAMSLVKESGSDLDSKIPVGVAEKLQDPINKVGENLISKDQTQQNEPEKPQNVVPKTGKAGKAGKTETVNNQK
jgi:hypothetical protein